jgi:hypothetical protein
MASSGSKLLVKTFLCFSSYYFKNGEEDLSRAEESMRKGGGMLIKMKLTERRHLIGHLLNVVLKHLFYIIYAPAKESCKPYYLTQQPMAKNSMFQQYPAHEWWQRL